MADSLPYADAQSGERALIEVQKILAAFGCQSFGHMLNYEKGELVLQFRFKDTPIIIRASFHGYAAAWLKKNPYSPRMRKSRADHEREAMEKGRKAVYSIVRDWIKGQITAIQCGILSFEGAFLGQIMLPERGKTILECVAEEGLIEMPAAVPMLEKPR